MLKYGLTPRVNFQRFAYYTPIQLIRKVSRSGWVRDIRVAEAIRFLFCATVLSVGIHSGEGRPPQCRILCWNWKPSAPKPFVNSLPLAICAPVRSARFLVA